MNKIIIFNNLTEQMSGLMHLQASHKFAIKSAFRNMWLVEEGDIVVSPIVIPEYFKIYLKEVLQLDICTITFVYPPKEKIFSTVTDEMLMLNSVIAGLKEALTSSKGWKLQPCYYSSGVAKLVDKLDLEKDKSNRFFEQKGADIFNRKSLFRQIASSIPIPIPRGEVVYTQQQLSEAIKECVKYTDIVIVKQDSGAGGMGNIIYTRTNIKLLPGARAIRFLPQNINREAKKIFHELEDSLSKGLVVEEYHHPCESFYVEFIINSDGTFHLSHSGTILTQPSSDGKSLEWSGLMIPAQVESSVYKEALHSASLFIQKAIDIGYTGFINLDIIYTKDGDFFLNESNGRWGGGTVLDELATKLLGEKYYENHYILSVRNLNCQNLNEFLEKTKEQDRNYDFLKKTGIIVLSPGDPYTKEMECMVVSESLDDALANQKWLQVNYG